MFARREAALAFVALTAVGATVSGCSSSNGDKATGAAVSVELTSDGCAPSPSTATAGLVTFEVHNKNAGAVTEAELLKGGKSLGKRKT